MRTVPGDAAYHPEPPDTERFAYEALIAAVHPADGSLPTGQLYHAAGASQDGWTITAVHDSKASWETFRDSILMPHMQQGIDGGFTAPPEEIGFDIVNEVRG